MHDDTMLNLQSSDVRMFLNSLRLRQLRRKKMIKLATPLPMLHLPYNTKFLFHFITLPTSDLRPDLYEENIKIFHHHYPVNILQKRHNQLFTYLTTNKYQHK